MAVFELDEGGLEELFHDPAGEVARIMEQAAYKVENAAKRNLLRPGTGGIYTPGVHFFTRGGKVYRFERIGTHRASAPGEPASSDTGQLLNSVHHVMEDGDDGIQARVGSDLDHAAYTELGTRYMAPRPWLRPALDALHEP